MKDESRPPGKRAASDLAVDSPTVADFAGLLDTLGFTDDEFVSISHKPVGGVFQSAVMAPGEAPGYIDRLLGRSDAADVWFGVNPVKGPERERAGRGKAADVTRLATLPADLDVKAGGCRDPETAYAITDDLSGFVGTEPSVLVHSGHGVHPYWPVVGGHIGENFGTEQAAVLLRRWGRLVGTVAQKHGAKPDPVFDLPRVLRVPGTFNCKGAQCIPITAYRGSGEPLSLTEVIARLDEAGIDEAPLPRQQQPSPNGSVAAGHNQAYVDAIVADELATLASTPPKGGKYGGRNNQLNVSALTCARLPGVDRDWLRRQLLDACATNGELTDPDGGRAKCEGTIDSAFAKADSDGPRSIPESGANYSTSTTWFDDPLADNAADGDGVGGSQAAQVGADDTAGASDAVAFDPLNTANGAKPDSAGFLSDANISKLLVERKLRGKYCWVPGLGWMRWDGTKLARTTTEDVVEQSRLFATELVASAVRSGDPSKIHAYTRRMNAGALKAAADLAKGQMLVKADLLDAHPDLLNVRNGVVNLRTGELMAHDPRLLLTKCAPTNYYPDATHADWTAALEALPADVREWMQERFGQAITGEPTPDDMLLVLHGSGSNGKSSIMIGIIRALGEHAVIVPDRVLLANPGDHPTELMTLRGARLALLEETPEVRRLNVKRLKDTIGTPMMTARLIRQDNVSWMATHSLFVSTNYKPRVEETDHGTWRRLTKVTFPYTYRKADEELTGPDDRRGDPTLRDRIKLGGDGRHEAVLAWLVKGAVRVYANGMVMSAQPRTVIDDTRAWRHESDLVLRWFDEALVADKDYCVPGVDLYRVFADWLTTNGNQKWSSQTFADRFGQHDEIVGHGIAATRVMLSATKLVVVRPTYVAGSLPERFRAWVGVRFRTNDDDRMEASEQRKHGPWTEWTDGLDEPLVKPFTRDNPEHPSTPSTARAADAETLDFGNRDGRCSVCCEPMYASASINRGMCERCWLTRRGDPGPARTAGLTQ